MWGGFDGAGADAAGIKMALRIEQIANATDKDMQEIDSLIVNRLPILA